MVDQLTQKLAQKALSRRGFLASAGAVTAATMVGCGNDTTFTPTQPTTPTPAVTVADSDILNFALNLEYLEAQFYLYATTGSGISSTDTLSGGAVTVKAGAAVPFQTTLFKELAAELAQTELQHVRAIQAAIKVLGGTPVASPAIDLLNSFNAIASAAGLGTSFDPFANELNFLVAAMSLERVGVSAYTGAADLISSPTILSAAAGIQAAEAYHTGATRMLLANNAATTGVSTSVTAANSIGNLIVTLGGGTAVPLSTGLSSSGTYSTPATYAVVDSNALSLARTVDQVLHIVYGTGGTSGVSSGGFFPSGLNGLLKTTTS